MIRVRMFAAPLAVALLSLTLSAAQTDRLGHVDVTVSRGNDTPVTGLTIDDFVVAVDGHGEDIVSVSKTPTPLNVLVAFDQSASMTTMMTRRVTDGVEEQLAKVLAPGDIVRFASASGSVTIGAPSLSVSRRDLGAALGKLPKPADLGGSPIWDAVTEGAQALADATGRRLLVLVSDGHGTGNRRSAEEAAGAAAANRVAVSVVDEGTDHVLRQDNAGTVAVRASPVLEWISRTTGGQYYQDPFARFQTQHPVADEWIARAVAAERVHYTLTVAVPDDGKFHDLRVRVITPDCTVRAPSVIRADRN